MAQQDRSIMNLHLGGILPTPKAEIRFKCPNCGVNIHISEMPKEKKAVCCSECKYQMTKRSDFRVIVQACLKQDGTNHEQMISALRILKSIAEYEPEAALEIGKLGANLPAAGVDIEERWKYLMSAYANGEFSAVDLLSEMCQRHTQRFTFDHCRCCGAKRFYSVGRACDAVCVFCGSKE